MALESLQKRALRIIDDDGNYELMLMVAETVSLEIRREYLTEHFFKRQSVLDTNSVLNYLLSPKRDLEAVGKLRNVKLYNSLRPVLRAVLSNGPAGPGPRAPKPQGPPNSPCVSFHLVK